MALFSLPQNDWSPLRRQTTELWRSHYYFGEFGGIPVNAELDLLDKAEDALWDTSILQILLRIRANMEQVVKVTGWQFTKPLPELLTPEFVELLTKTDMAKLSEYFIPDLGQMIGGGRAKQIEDFRQVYQTQPLPPIADRYESDESFAYSFVAGPNPAVIKQMQKVPANFPITSAQLRQLPAFAHDTLDAALADGRVYYLDFGALTIMENGMHGDLPKYVYQPLCAFCVPKTGGLMQPFAIQTGQESTGRELYTPADGWSWQIAKGMVMAANFNHHEAVTHLGTTHLVIEPLVVCMYRNMAETHPIYGLLNHHFEGTLQINYLAINWLLQPDKPFSTLTGATLESVHALAATERLGFDFKAGYLPTRLKVQGLLDRVALPVYPYRDDGLLVWEAIRDFATDFVQYYYDSESAVLNDTELQAWAAEIVSPSGGKLKNFTAEGLGIQSRDELIGILTMIIFTAGPQHAAVNFPQQTDMSFTPAAPLAGFIPEITGKGHTQEDYLNFLPPLDVACASEMVLDFLGNVYFDCLGNYGATFAEDLAMIAIIGRFKDRLGAVESMIDEREKDRPFPYPHLRPSKIPQSINV